MFSALALNEDGNEQLKQHSMSIVGARVVECGGEDPCGTLSEGQVSPVIKKASPQSLSEKAGGQGVSNHA